MNYYERHLGDYAKDTAHLTMVEHGAYGLLLDRYYSTEEGIPAEQAHRVARARTREEKAAVDAVLAEFFTLADGVWTHARVQREIAKASVKINAARENGKHGGRPKKANPEPTDPKPTGFPLGSENETQSKALQTPDTRHQTPGEEKTARKRAPPSPALERPEAVGEGVWRDWLALRKAKRAPVTPTVLSEAAEEAQKAGMPLEAFLRVWCARGSQGLQADWLKPHERQGAAVVPFSKGEALIAGNIAAAQRWLERSGQ